MAHLVIQHMACFAILFLQVKQFFVGKDHVGDVPLHLKIASGLATGAIAITVASPTDLVKVRC
jgi:solute carrier family 25 uncoupling protein 8/9